MILDYKNILSCAFTCMLFYISDIYLISNRINENNKKIQLKIDESNRNIQLKLDESNKNNEVKFDELLQRIEKIK
jgi:predicted Holliday junction resolvase-like endonuclease